MDKQPKEKKYVIDNAQLMAEWDWEKNNELGLCPHLLTCGSGKKAWWKCRICHNDWQSDIKHRNIGRGCPRCSILKRGYSHTKTRILNNGSLANMNPNLAAQWHPTKNQGLTPDDVTSMSNKIVWWKCEHNHEWQASINNRAKGRGCPYCSNKKILEGYNDLMTTHPALTDEWNWEKNKLRPTQITSGSDLKVWWKCERGHEWETTVTNRSLLNRGCPQCTKELQTSFPEQVLYFYISKLFPSVFNRYRVNGVEIDIYIEDIQVGIEYDGYYYHSSETKSKLDDKKDHLAQQLGISLYRIKENEDMSDVWIKGRTIYIPHRYNDQHLQEVCHKLIDNLGVEVSNSFFDIARDRSDILNCYVTLSKANSILNVAPLLAQEWNYEKNGNLTPDMFSPTSHKKVWWKCSKGHEWEAMIANRFDKKRGCPYCAGQKGYRIQNIETGEVFDSFAAAARSYGLSAGDTISLCCKCNCETAGGYHWKFYNEDGE